MKNFYMHVGLPRCASTLIEYVFFKPEYDPYQCLIRAGINPLSRLSIDLRRTAELPHITDEMCQQARDHYLPPLLNDDYRGYFVSDESFTAFKDTKGAPTVFADRARFTERFLEGFQPRVILVVRNQVSIVESYYGLHIQNGGTMPFLDYFSQFPVENLDWLPIADAFAAAVGEENLSVVPFDRATYGEAAPYNDFFDALFEIMEVEDRVSLADMPVANQSLDPDLFPAQIRANRELDPESAKKVFMILYETFPKPLGKTMNLLTEDQKKSLRHRFQQSNETLFRRFMPSFDGTSYLPR